jgi:medium-chain acyl-[acyl-carrier-protein] hydrolase
MNGLLRLFQDVGYNHALDRDQGSAYTERTRCTWYLLSWQICRIEMPEAGDYVTVSTHIYECKASLAYKSIEMRDVNGKLLAVGDTKWVYMNIDNQEPAVSNKNEWPESDFGGKTEIPPVPRRIYIPDIMEMREKEYVKPYLIDTNGHANNVKLTELAMSVSGADAGCETLRAEFKKQVAKDTYIYPYVAENNGETVTVFKNEDGEIMAVFSFGS